jgi:SagB-type dehydrogenase family enzyme
VVHEYHDGTKHDFTGFARSLGYLDWASQPRPFRAFAEAPIFPLFPACAPAHGRYAPSPATYDAVCDVMLPLEPLSAALIGDVLRHALGLSAWKRFGASRWSLRVNPSSGNLHPTEAYVICGTLPGLAEAPAVYHYAADRHLLEQRCIVDTATWNAWCGEQPDVVLIALTSIHWREAWKYGERAFRYCQHDLGHAMAAVGVAAALVGRRAALLPGWSHQTIAALTGIDRDEDFVEAEREEPGAILALVPLRAPESPARFGGQVPLRAHDCAAPAASIHVDDGRRLGEAARDGRWTGRASQLSEDHVQWSFIDEIARVTADPGHPSAAAARSHAAGERPRDRGLDARALILQRRSAVAFDGRSASTAHDFFDLLARVMPGRRAPWDVSWWTPRIHLALFVHRVTNVEPGLYLLPRDPAALERLRSASAAEFLWEPAHDELPLVRLTRRECRILAKRLSCDQDIAADGFFSLAMIAEFDHSLDTYGASFYRHLFWESGMVGQALYLEAEAGGARATGIGCFYDDPVHQILGLRGHAFQSLYHFTVGMPVDDTRLTTEPGYDWER